MTKPRKKSPNSDAALEFDPKNHIGRCNGIIWPSVTQLLQEFGLIDYSMVPKDRLEAKRLIGIRVHAASTMIDNGSLDEKHFNKKFPECVQYLEAYRKFRTIESFEPIHKDKRYFSHKWKFHGAPDEQGVHIGKNGTEYALIDYKTTWRMYESTGAQLAAYALLIKETMGITVKKRIGLLLKPTGNYDKVEFNDPKDETEFLYCSVLHWAKRLKYKSMTESKLIKMYSN